jgi:hypothetical protein
MVDTEEIQRQSYATTVATDEKSASRHEEAQQFLCGKDFLPRYGSRHLRDCILGSIQDRSLEIPERHFSDYDLDNTFLCEGQFGERAANR